VSWLALFGSFVKKFKSSIFLKTNLTELVQHFVVSNQILRVLKQESAIADDEYRSHFLDKYSRKADPYELKEDE
jgi:hypothetical protein